MVEVANIGFFTDIKETRSSRKFPNEEQQALEAAIENVPRSIFEDSQNGQEVRKFDGFLAEELPAYEHEHDSDSGRNPECKLWKKEEGFDHSVDLYNPEKRIAIEIEKSERKRVSDDLIKFNKGGKTQRGKRKKIEFGCIIVPVNYRGSGNIFSGTMKTLEFMRSFLFVEDVAVFGYRDPRGE